MTAIPEPPLEAQSLPLIGTVIDDRYRIERKIGEGGMGVVYLASHTRMRRPVAVKVLHREMTAMKEAAARFEREAVVAARINHPSLIRATDFGTLADGSFFLVLDYVEGTNLRELAHGGPFDEQRVLRLGQKIADALAAAHESGVVHRDLKPENLMVTREADGTEGIRIFDFGMASLRGSVMTDLLPITKFGALFGTPKYMAPEQALQQGADHRVDMYALGVILYELLAGAPPFVNEDVVALLTQKVSNDAPPPLPESVSRETRDLVMRLIARDPIARGHSMTRVRDELSRLLARKPNSRMSPFHFRRLPRLVQLGLTAAAAAVATALTMSAVYSGRAKAEHDVSRSELRDSHATRAFTLQTKADIAAERPGMPRETQAPKPAQPLSNASKP